MPLYMDRHEVPGASPEDVAAAHVSDLLMSSKHHVEFFSYWFDSTDGIVSCFAKAPSKHDMEEVHRESHGLMPSEIIEVSEDNILRFLGKVHDPADSSEITSQFRTIMFTDLENSTGLLASLGESAYFELLEEHDLIIRRALVSWQGREVKHTGDGLLVSFESVSASLLCALAIHEGFEARPAQAVTSPLRVRIGLDAGEPVDHNDDIFGTAVTTASRICDIAPPGHAMVSEKVYKIGKDDGFGFGSENSTLLKGFSAPVSLFELLASPTTRDL